VGQTLSCAGVDSVTISAQDHIAIQRLMYRYARCADHKDYAGFSEVFCEDAVFVYRGEAIISLAAIQEMMLALETYRVTLHQVQNVLYDVSGINNDAAVGETYCLASHLFDDSGEVHKIDMGIIYKDKLRRTEQGWRIAHRDFSVLWSQTSSVD
jgi:uncharacterized protein (TIGR02246 family)